MSLNCISADQIKDLEIKYGIKNLSIFSTLTQIELLDDYLGKLSLKDIKEKEKEAVRKNLREDILDLLNALNSNVEGESTSINKNSFYVQLKTGTEDKDVEKGFSRFDLGDFSEMFNSAFISLYNSASLFQLLNDEKKAAGVKRSEFKNENLTKVFYKFLKQIDEITKKENIFRLNAIKEVFKNEDAPFKNYEKDVETKMFYVEQVFPFMIDFLRMYYQEYFKPNIWAPKFAEAKVGNAANSTIDELVRINPEFGALSRSKDILVGTNRAFIELEEELSKKGLSVEKKIEIINNSPFNKVADVLMEAFRYNDKSFGGMQDVNSEEIAETDEENNIQYSDDTKITREGFSSSGNEKSGFDSASSETKLVLSSLFDIGPEGMVTDIYGLPTLLNEVDTFKQLSKLLRGKIDYSVFYKTLQENREKYPFIKQLLSDYLPIDPSKDIEEFFDDPKYNDSKRKYLYRVKQAFLQDLSKDRLEAKEINLFLKKKWKKNGTSYNAIRAEVNNAKQKTQVSIKKDATTRFHQKYFKEKQKVFGEALVGSNQKIRLETLVKAALKFKKISTQSLDDINLKDALDILAVFGIVPSRSVKSLRGIKRLITEEKKGKKSIERFFSLLPLEDNSLFKAIVTDTSKKRIPEEVKYLQKIILSKIKEFENKPQSLENTQDLITALKNPEFINATLKSLKVIEETNNYTLQNAINTNNKVKSLVEGYITLITDRFIDSKKISSSKEKGKISLTAKELENNLLDEFEALNRIELNDELTNKISSAEEADKLFDKLTNLTDPMNQLQDIMDGLYKSYYALEGDYVLEDDGITDFSGKPRHLIQSLNNLKIKENDLNERSNKLLVRFPELDPKRNPLIKSSFIFNLLYDIDAEGNIKPKSQSNLKISINSILGVKLESKDVNSGGLSINSQYEQDQILSSMILLLFNGHEESMNVDKEAAYNILFKGLNPTEYLGTTEKVTMTKDFLPIPSSMISNFFTGVSVEELQNDKTIKVKKYLNYATGNKGLKAIEPIAGLYKNYLTQYLLMYYKIEKGDLQYVKDEYENLGKNYKGLGLFEKDSSKDPKNYIIDAELKEQLKQSVLELDLKGKSLGEMTQEIENVILNSKGKTKTKSGYMDFQQGLFNHFVNQVEDLVDSLRTYSKNYSELDNLIKLFEGNGSEDAKSPLPYISDLIDTADGIRPDNTSLLKGLLLNYVVNYEILAQEKLLLFYGDPMFLKESSYVKRASSPGSTGTFANLDQWDLDYFNNPKNKSAFAFAKALNEKLIKEKKTPLNMDLHKLDYKFRYGQVEDNIIKSAVYNQLLDGFKQSIKQRFGNKFSEKEIDEKAKVALAAYNKLNEADGYGVITLDWYKILSELTKTWGPEQDYVYDLLAAGKEVPYSLLSVTFPVRKFQYTGSIFKDDQAIPADGLHKFSLAPILPGSDNNLQTKAENLMKEGKAYEIFSSANKKEKLLNPSGEKDYFYDGNQTDRIIKPLEARKVNGKMVYDSGKQVIYGVTNLIKDQVHIDTAVKDKVILARQLKRVGKTDLFENGIPFDFKGNEKSALPLKQQWDSLTQKQKKNASRTYKIYRGIVDDIGSLIEIEQNNILEELGFEMSEENGKTRINLIPGVGRQKLIDTLKKELRKRTVQQKSGSGNVYLKLLSIESKNEDVELEAFVNQKTLKSIMVSIINKNTRFRKFNGSNLIQAPVTGMESASFTKDNIGVDQTGYLKTYTYGENVNSKKIKQLEKEKQAELDATKSKDKRAEITELYDAKINALKATRMSEVMMTFTPEWEYLLGLYHKGYEIGTLENLNKIIRTDKEWVEENKDKLSILAVRIPIQDPNSIEAFIVKEFLPMSVGAKIVVPSEIVAKSGGDFDIDKLMVYYYNVDKETGEIPFDNSTAGLENRIIKGYLDLLLLPEMFYKLITANSIAVLKDEDKDENDNTPDGQIVDELNYYKGQSILRYDNTDLRMPLFNLRQKTILQIAKKLLGHAATIRSNFEELKHAGLTLADSYNVSLYKWLSKKERKLIKDNVLLESLTKSEKTKSKIRLPFIMEDGSLAYNTTEENKINVSESFNKDNVSITEIISAVMNGLVDVASKPWIVIFSMNEELTSYNFLMLLSGVPARMVFKVNNQRIIRDFIDNKLALKQSLYKRILNQNNSQKTSRLLEDTFINIIEEHVTIKNGKRELSLDNLQKLENAFRELGASDTKDKYIFDYLNTYIKTDANKEAKEVNDLVFRTNIESFLFDLQNNLDESKFLTDKELTTTLNKTYAEMSKEELGNQIKLLAFTLFMKPVGEGLTSALEAIDYDKTQSENIHDEYTKVSNLKLIKSKGYFDKKSFTSLQNLHIARPYNLSNLTKAAASIVAPITENSQINKFAISLAKLLKKKFFIVSDKEDSLINSFKSDFINYIVQNFGTIEGLDKDGKSTGKENIVEYFIKNGVFIDKRVESYSGKEYLSTKIEDKSLPNQLFTLIETFDKFNSLDVFSNYLIPVKGKKIENSEEDEQDTLDYIYKVGRIFRNLNPSELDNYNKQIKTFGQTNINIKDVLFAIEQNGPEVLEKYVSEDNIAFDDVYNTLKDLQSKYKLGSFSNITNGILNKEAPEINKLLVDFKRKANQVKNDVSYLLPYLSLLQSTALYSTASITNMFVSDNYKIAKDAIVNFRNEVNINNPDEFLDLLKNFTVLFLINNIKLLTSDKRVELLKMIAGRDALTNTRNDFDENAIITNSNYFNNYYKKIFSIMDRNSNFAEADNIIELIRTEGMEESFLYEFLELKPSEILEDDTNDDVDDIDVIETQFEIGDENKEPDDEVFNVVNLRNNNYVISVSDQEVKDLDGKRITGNLKNEVLANYYSSIDQLKISHVGDDMYYIAGSKIMKVTEDKETGTYTYKNIKPNIAERSKILDLAFEHTLKPCNIKTS